MHHAVELMTQKCLIFNSIHIEIKHLPIKDKKKRNAKQTDKCIPYFNRHVSLFPHKAKILPALPDLINSFPPANRTRPSNSCELRQYVALWLVSWAEPVCVSHSVDSAAEIQAQHRFSSWAVESWMCIFFLFPFLFPLPLFCHSYFTLWILSS